MGAGPPVEADAVAHAAREDLDRTAVRLHARDRLVQRPRRYADVARRAHRHVEPAVGTERDELPAVVAVTGVAVGDHDGRGRAVEPRLDLVEPQDPGDLRDVERAVADGDAVGAVEPARQGPRFGRVRRSARARNRVDDALVARADEERARGGEGYRPPPGTR